MKSVITLSPDAAQQALEAAIRTQATVVLELLGFPGATVNGLLISGDDRALLLEVTGHPTSSVEFLLNAQGTATVFGESRLQFPTVITDAPRYGRSTLLAISRPTTVSVLERRRFVRARLAPSSRVNIRWLVGNTEHCLSATLLNVSAEGLACRIQGDAACGIRSGSQIRATFELPGQEGAFDLDAVVMNNVPASEGCVILGLKFQDGGRAIEQVAALRSFLEKATNLRRAVEACV
jgi:hypothetical protein